MPLPWLNDLLLITMFEQADLLIAPLHSLQRYRIKWGCIFLSDLASADGRSIKWWFIFPLASNDSWQHRLDFPNERLSQSHWPSGHPFGGRSQVLGYGCFHPWGIVCHWLIEGGSGSVKRDQKLLNVSLQMWSTSTYHGGLLVLIPCTFLCWLCPIEMTVPHKNGPVLWRRLSSQWFTRSTVVPL